MTTVTAACSDVDVGIPGWYPRSRPQAEALVCPAQILCFGGAAGSLKSETLLIDAVLERDNPRHRAILFRRTHKELEKSLIRRSRELYGEMGAVYNETKTAWRFPSGAIVEFGYCLREADVESYRGSPHNFIGIDESTHWTETMVRFLMGWLRSPDPALQAFARVRLATNPGNIGHDWHLRLFQGPKCFHCGYMPGVTLVPGKIYRDKTWSDKNKIHKTTCFIPGRLSDHTLLGADYLATLAGLPEALREALLNGCWSAFEGQFFKMWDPATMVVRRRDIREEDWWTYWVGADYGFSDSAAAAYLLARGEPTPDFPRGRIYVLSEYVSRGELAAAFAESVVSRFSRTLLDQPRHILYWYLSHELFGLRGADRSLADQMIERSGVGWERAANDRPGGAQLISNGLESGEVVIADCCPLLIKCLPTRVHADGKGMDVEKIPGDPLDDCYDAFRYALYSHARAPRVPDEVRVARTVTSTDPTTRMRQFERALAELRRSKQGFRTITGGRRRGGL